MSVIKDDYLSIRIGTITKEKLRTLAEEGHRNMSQEIERLIYEEWKRKTKESR